ncbi:MAG: LD-carboxypeptidase, partial [Candidatus Limivicinus sp.]
MRYPRFLSDGAVLGFPAPSFGCSIEPYRSAFDRAQKVLRERGYGTVCGPNAYADDGTGISSSPERCGREITEMMLSKDTDALISCGGGELMCEILPHTDFGSIAAAEPKWFM